MALHSQSFYTKNTTFNVLSKNDKVDYYQKFAKVQEPQ